MMNIVVCVLGSLVLSSHHYGQAEDGPRAVVTLQPNWPKIYREEKITLTCAIEDGGDTEWEYVWRSNSSIKPPDQRQYHASAFVFHSGHYRCRGRDAGNRESKTKWSPPVKLTVHGYLPKPVLRASPSWLSPGASVALKCELEHASAGWRFYWYQTVPDGSHGSYRTVLLPGSVNGTAEDSYVVDDQTHTVRFKCRAGRGAYYTHYSEPVFVWSAALDAAASLTVSPDTGQHFFAEPVSLSCGGNSTAWGVMRLTDAGPSRCRGWGIMSGSTCTIPSLQYSDAVYWCESASGEFSNAVNITVYASRPGSSWFTVTLLAGVMTGIFLVILLLLVYWVTKSCGPCSSRAQTQSKSLDETQEHVYSSLSQGDVCVYESIRSVGTSGKDGRAKEQSHQI